MRTDCGDETLGILWNYEIQRLPPVPPEAIVSLQQDRFLGDLLAMTKDYEKYFTPKQWELVQALIRTAIAAIICTI